MSTSIKQKALLDELVNSSQNPLLGSSEFYKHCKPRFRNACYTQEGFKWLLNYYKENDLLVPIYSNHELDYYSTFQVYPLYLLEKCRIDSLKLSVFKQEKNNRNYLVSDWKQLLESNKSYLLNQVDDYNTLLFLLLDIQDYYLPEVRGNRRWGQIRNYFNSVAIEGTYFSTTAQYTISQIREWRDSFIEENIFNPEKVLADSKLENKKLQNWISKLRFDIRELDPLNNWELLIQYINYNKRLKLKYDALLVQDLIEISEILRLFVGDINRYKSGKEDSNSSEYQEIKSSKLKEVKYSEAINKPFQMLEYLCNEYGINPRPRGIIFTEGEEWKAIEKLFEFYNLDPQLLGIEFRSIGGEGNFSLSNWQCFIEYMHEKQVLIYFVLDNEGRTAKEASKLFKNHRKFKYEGLDKVIPKRDRIKIWGARKNNSSFEEANFTDKEIVKAISIQSSTNIRVDDVKNIRSDANRKRGLIKDIEKKFAIKVDKSRLDVDLIQLVIDKRRKRPNVKNKRPIENFVYKSGELIMLNHLPTNVKHQKINIETGLLG